MAARPPKPKPDEAPTPNTFYGWQSALGDDPPNTVADIGPQPASSPWGSGPQPGDELPIDRTEDAATGGLPDMTEVQQ
jgi:hypothetical protein